MKLNQENKHILKSFSDISEQIYITDSILGITNPEKSIGVYYEWGVQVPEPFGIPNIISFLSTLDIYNDPVITKDNNLVWIKEGKKKHRQVCLNEQQIIKPITKDKFVESVLSKREIESEFVLTKEMLSDIKKSLNILKNSHIKFEGNVVCTFDKKLNSNADSENQFVMEIDGLNCKTKIIKAEYLSVIMQDEYTFKLYDSFIWAESKTFKLQYMFKLVAL